MNVGNSSVLSDEEFNDLMDPGNDIEKWILTRTPYPVGILLTVYLLFVLQFGPKFMSNREPYRFKNIIRIYNVIQVYYNSWLVYQGLVVHNVLYYLFRYTCSVEGFETIDYVKETLLILAWHYMVMKMLDLLDTVFMILQKRNCHVSVLHVYHHCVMVLVMWVSMNYFKSIHAILPVATNAIVHSIMYSYYFLSTFPQLKKYLWWKVYLTKLQMSQFVLILMYFIYIYWKGCPISKMFNYSVCFIAFTLLCLFANFYVKTYMKKPSAVDIPSRAKQL